MDKKYRVYLPDDSRLDDNFRDMMVGLYDTSTEGSVLERRDDKSKWQEENEDDFYVVTAVFFAEEVTFLKGKFRVEEVLQQETPQT